MMEVSPSAAMSLNTAGVLKRPMPVQLALSIGPTGAGIPGQALLTQQGKQYSI